MELKKEGHTCMAVNQSYPTEFTWCKRVICIEKTHIYGVNGQYFETLEEVDKEVERIRASRFPNVTYHDKRDGW